MKILIINPSDLPIPAVHGGAVETLISLLADENEKINMHKLWVISTFDEKALKLSKDYCNTIFKYTKKINKNLLLLERLMIALGMPFSFNPYIKKARLLMKKEKFDWVIVQNISSCILPLRRGYKGNMALHLHNDMLNKNTRNGYKIAKCCDMIITVSNYIGKCVSGMNCVTSGLDDRVVINTCYNRIDTSKFLPRNQSNVSNKDHCTIMFTGRLRKEKGPLELISAFKMALSKNPKLNLKLLGSDWFSSNYPTEYIEELKLASQEVKDKISFTGYVSYDEVPNVISEADIIVVPSQWEEPFGLTVIEAMAMAKPVIVSDSGGIPEIIVKDGSIIVDRGENFIEDLSNAIVDLSLDPKRRILMGKVNRKHVEDNFKSDEYLPDLTNQLNKKLNDKL